MEPFSIDFRAYSGRILAAVFFLLSAVVRSVWLRARAGKPEERENAKRSVEPSHARGVPSGAPAQTAERGRGARPRSLTTMLSCCRCGSVVRRLRCLQLSLRTRFPFPRSGPRGAKTAPGAARSAPGAPQEPPKRRKKGAKKVTTFGFRSRGGGPPGSDFGAILEPPGEHFQAITLPENPT